MCVDVSMKRCVCVCECVWLCVCASMGCVCGACGCEINGVGRLWCGGVTSSLTLRIYLLRMVIQIGEISTNTIVQDSLQLSNIVVGEGKLSE